MIVIRHRPEPVTRPGVNMKLRRNLHLPELLIDRQRPRWGTVIVPVTMNETDRRRPRIEREIARQRIAGPLLPLLAAVTPAPVAVFRKDISGLDRDGEIHMTGNLIEFVHRLVSGS